MRQGSHACLQNKSISSNSWSLCKSLASFSPDGRETTSRSVFLYRSTISNQSEAPRTPCAVPMAPSARFGRKINGFIKTKVLQETDREARLKRKVFLLCPTLRELSLRCFTGISGQFGDKNPKPNANKVWCTMGNGVSKGGKRYYRAKGILTPSRLLFQSKFAPSPTPSLDFPPNYLLKKMQHGYNKMTHLNCRTGRWFIAFFL